MGVNATSLINFTGVNFEPAFRRASAHKSRATNIGNILYRFAFAQAMCDFNDGALGIAKEEQVTFGIHHHRAANFVLPVVVMCNAAQ